MKTMYYAYVLQNELGKYLLYGDSSNMSLHRRLQHAKGDKLLSAVVTTNKGVYLKSRLKFRLQELRDTQYELQEMSDSSLYSSDDEEDVLAMQCLRECIDSLIWNVATLTSRVLGEGLEVTDELALACFDYRQIVMSKDC